jgi:Tfp pilus assembly protein PilO
MSARIDVRRDVGKIAGVLAALLVANLAFYLLLVYPRTSETAALESERDTFHETLKALRERTEGLRAAHKKVVEQEEALERFYGETLGTKHAKLVPAQREINVIGKEFGIDPKEVGYRYEDKVAGRVERCVISLPLEGGYTNLRQFIERVENSENFFVIDHISLSGTQEGGSKLNLSVQVATYFDAPWLVELQEARSTGRGRRRT